MATEYTQSKDIFNILITRVYSDLGNKFIRQVKLHTQRQFTNKDLELHHLGKSAFTMKPYDYHYWHRLEI